MWLLMIYETWAFIISICDVVLSNDSQIRNMDKYEVNKKIGKGSFGMVTKCHDHENNRTVAVKRIFFLNRNEGVPCSVIREIALLKDLDHCNIVKLLDVEIMEDCVNLVFEYLDLDLKAFIKLFPEALKDPRTIKSFLLQILRGVAYCHSLSILHRDLKPGNLLIDLKSKTVKIADFGLARAFGIPLKAYTRPVATLAYRAPEHLLDSTYSSPFDVWSAGCVFAEMVTRKPLFNGFCDSDVLISIFSMLGVPNEASWPGVTGINRFISRKTLFPSSIKLSLADVVTGLEPAGMDLLSKMLCLDPSQRITARDALKHSYFRNIEAAR